MISSSAIIEDINNQNGNNDTNDSWGQHYTTQVSANEHSVLPESGSGARNNGNELMQPAIMGSAKRQQQFISKPQTRIVLA